MAQGFKSGGRKSGTPNQITGEIKEHFSQLLQANLERLQKDIDSLEPKERIKVLLVLSRFVVPTVKSIEIEAIQSDINPFQIKIVRTGETNVD
jgi:hypothetical protein